LIFGEIITIVATRGQIFRLKCTKFYFGWDRWGSLQRSPDLLARFKGPITRRRGWEGREEKGSGGEGREREGRKCTVPPPTFV